MHTDLCDQLGIEFPIFAFTHCRDVVVAVSKAGGFGVLGAVGFSPEQLEIELNWIDEHIGDKPYGVDIVIPGKYEGMGEMDPEKLAEMLRGHGAGRPPAVRQGHPGPARRARAARGETATAQRLLGWTAATATPQVDVALNHPKMRLIANALGTPPARHHRPRSRRAAAWSPPCAARPTRPSSTRKPASTSSSPRAARAAATPARWARSCCGPRSWRPSPPPRCWPPAAWAPARRSRPPWPSAAPGVWSGTLWLTVEEADIPPAQKQQLLDATSRDTVRSRSFTGKPCRMLRSEWTDAWERARHPRSPAHAAAVHGVGRVRGPRHPLRRQGPVKVAFNPVRSGGGPAQHTSARPATSCRSWSRATWRPPSASTRSTADRAPRLRPWAHPAGGPRRRLHRGSTRPAWPGCSTRGRWPSWD